MDFFFQSCAEYLKMAHNHGHKLVRALQHEKEQRARLQDMVETLAQQHSKLEQAANAHTNRPAGECTFTSLIENSFSFSFLDIEQMRVNESESI